MSNVQSWNRPSINICVCHLMRVDEPLGGGGRGGLCDGGVSEEGAHTGEAVPG